MKEKATVFDYARLCKNIGSCEVCPLYYENIGSCVHCEELLQCHPDKANEIILNWCKEHPAETRQDRFLKMFPNVKIDIDGVIAILPCDINKNKFITSSCNCPEAHSFDSCIECRKKYWLAEVEENE